MTHINYIIIFTTRKRSLGQGYVFTRVCHSVYRRGVSVWGVSVRETPPQTETLPRMVKIGRYASYWNAFLFALFPYFLCIGCGCGVNCRLTSLKITLEDSDIDITETLKYLDLLIVSLKTRVHKRRIEDFPGGNPKGGGGNLLYGPISPKTVGKMKKTGPGGRP